jgi:hypothetical protein
LKLAAAPPSSLRAFLADRVIRLVKARFWFVRRVSPRHFARDARSHSHSFRAHRAHMTGRAHACIFDALDMRATRYRNERVTLQSQSPQKFISAKFAEPRKLN